MCTREEERGKEEGEEGEEEEGEEGGRAEDGCILVNILGRISHQEGNLDTITCTFSKNVIPFTPSFVALLKALPRKLTI